MALGETLSNVGHRDPLLPPKDSVHGTCIIDLHSRNLLSRSFAQHSSHPSTGGKSATNKERLLKLNIDRRPFGATISLSPAEKSSGRTVQPGETGVDAISDDEFLRDMKRRYVERSDKNVDETSRGSRYELVAGEALEARLRDRSGGDGS